METVATEKSQLPSKAKTLIALKIATMKSDLQKLAELKARIEHSRTRILCILQRHEQDRVELDEGIVQVIQPEKTTWSVNQLRVLLNDAQFDVLCPSTPCHGKLMAFYEAAPEALQQLLDNCKVVSPGDPYLRYDPNPKGKDAPAS